MREKETTTDAAHTVHRVSQPHNPVPDLRAIPCLLRVAEDDGIPDEHETDRDALGKGRILAIVPRHVVGDLGVHVMHIDRTREQR